MELVNLTQHNINIVSYGIIEPSGKVARVSVTSSLIGDINGIPLYKREFGEVQDLPEPVEGTMYIVSSLVQGACPDRKDLLAPGDLVRNDQGQPIGCRGLTL